MQNPKGKDKFVEIQEAYSILSDPEKKRQYDYGGANVSWPCASCLLFLVHNVFIRPADTLLLLSLVMFRAFSSTGM